jgi:hypothetical protein
MLGELIEIAKFILGFVPWILFLLLPTDGWNSLRAAVVICLGASVVFAWTPLRKGFILQWATVAFFLFSAVSLYCFKWIWLAEQMGILANGFLTGVIWFTILIGKPFTLQLARADLPRERWNDENLIRGCRFIAVFWGVLLLVPTVATAFRRFYPKAVPDRFYFVLSLACIILGIIFTTGYKRMKRKRRESAGNSTATPSLF